MRRLWVLHNGAIQDVLSNLTSRLWAHGKPLLWFVLLTRSFVGKRHVKAMLPEQSMDEALKFIRIKVSTRVFTHDAHRGIEVGGTVLGVLDAFCYRGSTKANLDQLTVLLELGQHRVSA